jgi:cell division septum initiation protein DivIVA
MPSDDSCDNPEHWKTPRIHHPVYEALDELVQEHAELRDQVDKLVKELGEFAQILGCSCSYDGIKTAILELRRKSSTQIDEVRAQLLKLERSLAEQP